jgi:hypothetical protein
VSGLRLDLIVRRYQKYGLDSSGIRFPEAVNAIDRWTWRLWSGSRIVSTSGSQLYSRRIDCARGAEVGAGLHDLVNTRCTFAWRPDHRFDADVHPVEVRIIDERKRGAK